MDIHESSRIGLQIRVNPRHHARRVNSWLRVWVFPLQTVEPQTQKFARLLLVLAGGGLIALVEFLFARQNGGGGTASSGVDQQKIEYGNVKFGAEKIFAIQETNTGDGTLRFKEDPYIEVVEGC